MKDSVHARQPLPLIWLTLALAAIHREHYAPDRSILPVLRRVFKTAHTAATPLPLVSLRYLAKDRGILLQNVELHSV